MRPALVVMGYHPTTKHAIDALAPSVFSRVSYAETVEEFRAAEGSNSDDLVALIASPSATPILKEISMATPNRLKWVHSSLTGVDAYKLDTIADVLTAPVSNARGVFSSLLAEHVVLSLLYFTRRVATLQHNRKNKVWDRFPNPPLRGATLGLVGYGEIARNVAQVATPFGLQVQGYRRSIPGGGCEGSVDDLGVAQYTGAAGFERVISTSDFVVSVLPNVKETHDLYTYDVFKKMKRSAVFVNIGRGVHVVEDDLVRALDDGTIRGAALDVFRTEPLPATSALWALPDDKLLLSDHSADISETSFQDSILHFKQHALQYVSQGKLPDYIVDIRRGY